MRLRRAPRPDRPASSWREHVGVENRQGRAAQIVAGDFPDEARHVDVRGQAPMQGASKQLRQRLASAMAACAANGGCRSGKRSAISSLCRIASPQGLTRSAYMSGLRSRKNCQVFRTSAILSRSRSAVSTSSLSREACARFAHADRRNNFARKIRRCSTALRCRRD